MRSDIENPKAKGQAEVIPTGGNYLEEAVNWFIHKEIELYGINENPKQKDWTHSPKAYGQLYIDDAALGCPLIYPEGGRPYVDWDKVRAILINNGVLIKTGN